MNDLMRRRGARIEDSTVRGSQSEPENPLDFQPSLPIEKKEYNGQPVVTFRDIDAIHQKPEGSARKRFHDNRRHFIEGVDYFRVTAGQLSEIQTVGIQSNNGGYIFTQTGYLMIVKSFTDDLSWAIQRELVNGYFAARRAGLTFMGTPVIPLAEAAKALGIPLRTARRRIEEGALGGRPEGRPAAAGSAGDRPAYPRRIEDAGRATFGMGDALLLEGRNLARFKAENAHAHITASALWIVTRSGFEKLKQA